MLFPQPYLPNGSKGPAVVILQIMLKVSGWNHRIIPDGDFGNETAQAVKDFQQSHGLDVDGCFGPATRAKFFEVYEIDANSIPDLDGETIVPAT